MDTIPTCYRLPRYLSRSYSETLEKSITSTRFAINFVAKCTSHLSDNNSLTMLPHIGAALLWLGIVMPATRALSQADLRYRSIYQVITDRFARADGMNPPCDPSLREYCGGTWRGITTKLDYIQEMGFDTGASWSHGYS
jgi:hypothetical protein